MKQHVQLCWECQNCRADKCSWMQDFTPVRGWEADEVTVHNNDKFGTSAVKTYAIKRCPNFVPDEVVEVVKTGRPSGTGARVSKLFEAIEKLSERQNKLKIKRGMK